jgi:hypothetical protein
MIFSRWRKNNRKVGIESCYALDEVEEGGTNLSERGLQHDNHRSLLDCVLIKVSKLKIDVSSMRTLHGFTLYDVVLSDNVGIILSVFFAYSRITMKSRNGPTVISIDS